MILGQELGHGWARQFSSGPGLFTQLVAALAGLEGPVSLYSYLVPHCSSAWLLGLPHSMVGSGFLMAAGFQEGGYRKAAPFLRIWN